MSGLAFDPRQSERRPDFALTVLRLIIPLLGIWAIYAQMSVLLGRTFHGLLSAAWLPAVSLLLFTIVCRKYRTDAIPTRSVSEPTDVAASRVIAFALLSISGLMTWRPGHPIAAAIYLLAAIFVLAWTGDRWTKSAIPGESGSAKRESIIVLIVMIASMIIALCEHRVNWDDAKYLHIVASTLDYPDHPMLVYENLHGVAGLKIYHPSVQLQTYELLVAAISKISGITHITVYYLILPPLWSALAVIAQWTLIRRLAGKHSALALVATFLLLAVWGSQRSYGAFAFDFVGRGIFLTFAVPALISAALDFAEKRTFLNWLHLFFGVWTGCMLTSTAYAVAPAAVILVLIACHGFAFKKLPDLMIGALAILWCPVLLAYVTWIAPIVVPIDVDSPGGAHFVFRGLQGRIALVLFAIAPFSLILVRWRSGSWLLRYVSICFLILLSGILLSFIGKYSSILSWRLLWAIPAPAIIGVGLAATIVFIQQRLASLPKLQTMTIPAVLALIVIAFVLAGKTVVFQNFRWPAPKVHQSPYNVARSLVDCSKSTDLILAPPEAAVPMAGLRGAPPLIAVRGHHLGYLSVQWGNEETVRRKRLFNVVQGKLNSPEDISWARAQLEAGSINRIMLTKQNSELDALRSLLRSLNVERLEKSSWEIWLPNTTAKEAMQFRTCVERIDK